MAPAAAGSAARARSAGAGSRPGWAAAAVAAALVAGFVAVRLALTTSVGGFVVAGGLFTDPAAVPGVPVLAGHGGYDGQFVYRLALEPWSTDATAHGIRLDLPAYRQQRIATATLGWLVAALPGVSTALALLLVNLLALVAAAWYAGRLVADAGRHPACALVLALPACMPISLGRDLTEPVAWAGVLAGLWYVRRRRWAAAAAALTLAILARETALLVAVGVLAGAVWQHWRHRHRPAADQPAAGQPVTAAGLGWLTGPLVVAAGWQLWLWHIWGELPLRAGPTNNLGDLPVVGVLKSIGTGFVQLTGRHTDNPLVGLTWAAERVALVLIIGYAAVSLLRRRSRVTAGEQVAWALSVAVAVSIASWAYDVQFLRAGYEALGLSVLVAVFSRDRTSSLALALAGAMTGGVAVMYALVP